MPTNQYHRQHGMILLGLMIALLLSSGLYWINQTNRLFTKSGQDSTDANVLQQAKEALLARAIGDANRPGSLPCPALTSEGNALAPPCSTFVGWLPWRSLDIPDLRDSAGERLWYVLSPAFQDYGTINSNSISSLSLDGNTGIAAIVIAPGAVLLNQSRPSNSPADYLDAKNNNSLTSNNDGDDSYFSASSDEKFNDKVVALTTASLFSGVSKRILSEVGHAFSTGGIIPFADTDNDGLANPGEQLGRFPYKEAAFAIHSTSWYSASPPFHLWHESLVTNGWMPLISYARLTRTISLNGQALTLP